MWRISANDLEDYIAEAYLKTAEHMAASDTNGGGPWVAGNGRTFGGSSRTL